jgi:two-component system, LuxR family, response regulator FixJ
MAPWLSETSLAAADRDTVYIVDDDADVRMSARALLESHDLAVEDFASARAFLEGFDGDCKACLLLDLNMPEMGGLELLEQLRRLEIAMPVIIVTAQGDAKARERARVAGAFAFFEKPVDDTLIATIDQALKAA